MSIVSLSYQKPLEKVDQYLEPNNKFLEQGYMDGHFLMSGAKEPREGGIVLAVFKGLESCEAYFISDPFFQQGIAHYEFIEFVPSRFCSELCTMNRRF